LLLNSIGKATHENPEKELPPKKQKKAHIFSKRFGILQTSSNELSIYIKELIASMSTFNNKIK